MTAMRHDRKGGAEDSAPGGPDYPSTFWDLVVRAREERPDHVFLADDYGRTLTGQQLHRDVAQRQHMGVDGGQRRRTDELD